MTPDAIGEGNIVERLRKYATWANYSMLKKLVLEAADEIERLRAAQPTILQGEGGSLAMTPAPQVQDGERKAVDRHGLRMQKQRFQHDPDGGVWGDCHRTAIACALGLPRDEVPHFCDDGV